MGVTYEKAILFMIVRVCYVVYWIAKAYEARMDANSAECGRDFKTALSHIQMMDETRENYLEAESRREHLSGRAEGRMAFDTDESETRRGAFEGFGFRFTALSSAIKLACRESKYESIQNEIADAFAHLIGECEEAACHWCELDNR